MWHLLTIADVRRRRTLVGRYPDSDGANRADFIPASGVRLQVVDGGAADVHLDEVLIDPRRDVVRDTGPVVHRAAFLVVPRDEVPHLAVGHVLLELSQRGRRVATAEPADRHQGRAGLELEIADLKRPDGGCRPTIVGALHQRLQCRVVTSTTTWAVSTGTAEAVRFGWTRRGHGPRVRRRHGLDRVRRRRTEPEKGSSHEDG